MGLLNKAVSNKKALAHIQTHSNSVQLENIKKKNQLKEFIYEIASIKPGIEYASELFNSLCLFLSISKGALLVRDTEGTTFSPTSFVNLDLTTTRHLRIESTIFDEKFNMYNEIINTSDINIRLFKQYMSIREFSALNCVFIIPFYQRGTLSALLFLIDPSEKIISNAKEISLNSEKFTVKLIKSLKPFNKILKSDNNKSNMEPISALQDYIKNIHLQDITFLIVTLNFTDLRNYLIKQLPNTESFEITSNIIKSITQLISPSGKLIKLSTEKYLLFYTIKTGKTPGIILHQINLAVSSFFNISKTLPEIETQIKTFQKNDYKSAEISLEGII